MALTNFTLTNAIGAGDLGPFAVSSTTGFPAVGVYATPAQIMQLDGEKMLVQVVPISGQVKVMQRGYDGTVAAAHEALSLGFTSSDPQDFLNVPAGAVNARPPYVDDVVTIGVDTTFTASGTAPTATTLPLPVKNTTYVITKATAAAITLISGTSAQLGVTLTFISGTAQAHAITYTPGFLGDTTSSDVATSASKVGAQFVTKCGYTGLWSNGNAGTGTGWTLG